MKSSSHLTRAIFRAIVNNRPFVVAECPRQSQHMLRGARPCLLPYSQRRTRMFGAILGAASQTGFEGAKNTPKNLEIALGKLVDLARAQRTQSRGPPDEELVDALRFVFSSSLESRRRLTRNEIYLATEVFKYLEGRGLVLGSEQGLSLQKKDLDVILQALALPSEKERFRSDTRALATLVFAALPQMSSSLSLSDKVQLSAELLPTYAVVLSRTGSAAEAMSLLQNGPDSNSKTEQVWIEVLKGLASEGRHKEFESVIHTISSNPQKITAAGYEDLTTFLAASNKFAEAWYVYEAQIASQIEPTTLELRALLELSARAGNFERGKPISQALQARIEEEGVLGTLLVWTASQADNVDSFEAEISKLTTSDALKSLDMFQLNHLAEHGYLIGRSDMIEIVDHLIDAANLLPDGKYYSIQLLQALKKGDLNSAGEIYEELIRQDIPSDNSDIPALNKFISALAFSNEADFNMLMQVVDNLLERHANFDAEALAGVCRVLLQRDDLEDLTGLLRHRVDFYPAVDRARVSAIFQQFILDPSIQDQRAFNAYELFRVAFPETPVEQRLHLMQSFFDRKRSDLACLVFGHMRQREDIEARPTADAYAQCFAGIAKCRDIDGLQMVYNMLKLDLEIDPNTKIRNGLMLAYIACQMPYTAMIDHFWKIMDSNEGPSYSTFLVALRACETWVPQGGYEARKIMAIIQAWDLEITKEMYDIYVGALAGQSEFENTIQLIEEMEDSIGERPDAMTIGAFYNAIPWQYRKDAVEAWAKKAYPELWEDLESYGEEIDEEWEVRYFKIDRSIDIDDPPLFGSGKYNPQITQDVVQTLEPQPEKAVSTL